MINKQKPKAHLLLVICVLITGGCASHSRDYLNARKSYPWNQGNEALFRIVDEAAWLAKEKGDEDAMRDLCRLLGVLDTERASYVDYQIYLLSKSSVKQQFADVVSRQPYSIRESVAYALDENR